MVCVALAARCSVLCWQAGAPGIATSSATSRRALLTAGIGWLTYAAPAQAKDEVTSAAPAQAKDEAELSPADIAEWRQDCSNCCASDWCNCDFCDCRAVLQADGYAPPRDVVEAANRATGEQWGEGLGWRSAKIPGWKTVGDGDLEVKESSIRGAGKGLFARQSLPVGAVLPPYVGTLRTAEEIENRTQQETEYTWCPVGLGIDTLLAKLASSSGVGGEQARFCIDAQRAGEGNPARFVNGARSRAQCERVNVEMCEMGHVLYFRTTASIPAGAELLVSYGTDYWDDFRGCNEQG